MLQKKSSVFSNKTKKLKKLIPTKTGKDKEMLVIPMMDHGNDGSYDIHRRQDFLVRHLRIEHPG